MNPNLGIKETIRVGNPIVFESDAPDQPFGVVFEDDGSTGYFYARDYRFPEHVFVDALHIYSVEGAKDAHLPSALRIIWSNDFSKAALLINNIPHAMFDFEMKIGYSQDAFPDPDPKTGWNREGWNPNLKSFFYND